MVVNPVEKNITEHRRMILTVIWIFEYLIVNILNDQIYYFVPIDSIFVKLCRIYSVKEGIEIKRSPFFDVC
jgi:hypothetical protein